MTPKERADKVYLGFAVWESGYKTAMHDMEHIIERDRVKKSTDGICPSCGKQPCTDGDFCCYCGQRIDWSFE